MAIGEGGQRIALVAAGALTAVALYGVPAWEPSDLRVVAFLLAGVTILLLAVTRLAGPVGVTVERAWIALFLAGMPVVYVARCIAQSTGGAWLAVEIAGLLLYAGLALAGWRGAPWLLAAGVAAHGIAWDAWHLAGSEYMPHWYALGCLLIDVGIAGYLATRVAAWRAARPVSSRS
jgi:hypothetical protein